MVPGAGMAKPAKSTTCAACAGFLRGLLGFSVNKCLHIAGQPAWVARCATWCGGRESRGFCDVVAGRAGRHFVDGGDVVHGQQFDSCCHPSPPISSFSARRAFSAGRVTHGHGLTDTTVGTMSAPVGSPCSHCPAVVGRRSPISRFVPHAAQTSFVSKKERMFPP